MSLVVVLSLATTAFVQGLDTKSVGCGNVNERCCKSEYLPEEERPYYEYEEGEWCWDYHNHICVEDTCTHYSALPCGGQDEPCCDPASYTSGAMEVCFDELYCVNQKCQEYHALDCGVEGERCCTEEDTQSSGNFHMYTFNESGFCFGNDTSCKDDMCFSCNQDGDECCLDIHFNTEYCYGDTTCSGGRCVSCGGAGQMCCNAEGTENYSTDHDCQDGYECMGGKCATGTGDDDDKDETCRDDTC